MTFMMQIQQQRLGLNTNIDSNTNIINNNNNNINDFTFLPEKMNNKLKNKKNRLSKENNDDNIKTTNCSDILNERTRMSDYSTGDRDATLIPLYHPPGLNYVLT